MQLYGRILYQKLCRILDAGAPGISEGLGCVALLAGLILSHIPVIQYQNIGIPKLSCPGILKGTLFHSIGVLPAFSLNDRIPGCLIGRHIALVRREHLKIALLPGPGVYPVALQHQKHGCQWLQIVIGKLRAAVFLPVEGKLFDFSFLGKKEIGLS